MPLIGTGESGDQGPGSVSYRRSALAGGQADGAGDSGAADAAVAVRHLEQILLVVVVSLGQ